MDTPNRDSHKAPAIKLSDVLFYNYIFRYLLQNGTISCSLYLNIYLKCVEPQLPLDGLNGLWLSTPSPWTSKTQTTLIPKNLVPKILVDKFSVEKISVIEI